jgi:hypothetical protein
MDPPAALPEETTNGANGNGTADQVSVEDFTKYDKQATSVRQVISPVYNSVHWPQLTTEERAYELNEPKNLAVPISFLFSLVSTLFPPNLTAPCMP